jgi:hypothetical protein
MGNILTIIIGVLIFSYTIYQIRRIYLATKKKVQIADLTKK